MGSKCLGLQVSSSPILKAPWKAKTHRNQNKRFSRKGKSSLLMAFLSILSIVGVTGILTGLFRGLLESRFFFPVSIWFMMSDLRWGTS